MRSLESLIKGYRRFLDTRYAGEAALYRRLGDAGQSPKVMVIGCSDSRVDPASIFDAKPGEVFVVRNVANLVPPYASHGDHHGTSAALEYAVTVLQVEHIVVMGHSQCGGVAAFIDGLDEQRHDHEFIHKWTSIMDPLGAEVLQRAGSETPEELQRFCECASVRQSLENLKTFPFIRERIAAGTLGIHGAHFSIANGELIGLDAGSGEFQPIK